jgi:hypothetical protein
MAKDYFQDITPPGGSPQRPAPPRPNPPEPSSLPDMNDDTTDIPIRPGSDASAAEPRSPETAARGIRNISAPVRQRPRVGPDVREAPSAGTLPPRPPRKGSAWWIWALAIAAVLILGGLLLFAFRGTTVTVVPKSHTVVFDNVSQYTAFPVTTAASGTLSYTVQTSDIEDSDVIPSATGTTVALPAAKASGNLIIYNNYSTSPVRLIKSTRFQDPNGLIFRVPADVSIPGKKGSTPGQVQVTVVADQNGSKYNIGPTSRFTVPGLKSNAAMYAGVYAKSTLAMTGGSSAGVGQGIDSKALSTAIADVRGRLQSKARDAASALSSASSIAFPDLAQITYQDLPNTNEAGGGVRIHESAHVVIPVFSAGEFAQAIAQSVSADAENAPISLVSGKGFTGYIASSTSSVTGVDPLDFTLVGQAELIWKIDAQALAAALAGRSSGAFQTIVNGFPGIQEAHARIEPFWKNTFPSNPKSIQIQVQPPQAAS